MLETAAFLRPLARRGVRVGCSVFALERGSHVHNQPAEYGITRIEDDRDVLLRGHLDHDHPDRVPGERILEIIETV